MAAAIPLTDLQDKVLITQPMDLFARAYSDEFAIPWPALDAAVEEVAGTGAMLTATVTSGAVTAVTVGDGGSGYGVAPNIRVGGPGTGAVLTATVSAAGEITSVTVDDGGSGYTTAPTLTVLPVQWDAIGASPFRADLYGREGAKVSKPHELMDYRGSRSLGKVATVRTSDDLMVDATIYDARLETVAFLLDRAIRTITAPAGATPGVRRLGLSRPAKVSEWSLVLRGVSAISEGHVAQIHIPRAHVASAWDREFGVDKWAGKTVLQLAAMRDHDAARDDERLGFFDEQFAA